MPKRKRTTEDLVSEQLESGRTNLFRALKAAKGLERQRLAKRIRDNTSTPEKVQRLEREVLVLKSLDLQQVAQAHIVSSILKIKAVTESPDLPIELKRGVARPDLPDDERAALHNVTSSLYNRPEVRKVVEKAVAEICEALGIAVPAKRGKGKKKQDQGHDGVKEGEPSAGRKTEQSVSLKGRRSAESEDAQDLEQDEAVDEEEFAGFSDDDAEEAALARFESRLGGSSDDDSEIDDDAAVDDGDSDGISLPDSISDGAQSPPPKRQATQQVKPGRRGDSTFLPMLMGGYVDDSESEASDIEKEFQPRKNRRGQRERQQIWEKKFKDQARHLQKQKEERNAGWDMKRGAVDEDAGPWKKGVRTPFGQRYQERDRDAPRETAPRQPAQAKELTGKLHPSWDAARKVKEKQKNATFTGVKVTFS